MNEIKNRLIEYFEEQDNKNLIMLVLSVIIASGIILYYINNYYSAKTEEILNKKVKIYKKLKKMRNLNSTLGSLKHKNKILKTDLRNSRSDFKFLISEIEVCNNLIIDENRFLNILHNYIKEGKNINSSFEIYYNPNKLSKYNLKIKGSFLRDKFFQFAEFLKVLEEPKEIITVNNLKAQEKADFIDYEMNVTLWSFQ